MGTELQPLKNRDGTATTQKWGRNCNHPKMGLELQPLQNGDGTATTQKWARNCNYPNWEITVSSGNTDRILNSFPNIKKEFCYQQLTWIFSAVAWVCSVVLPFCLDLLNCVVLYSKSRLFTWNCVLSSDSPLSSNSWLSSNSCNLTLGCHLTLVI